MTAGEYYKKKKRINNLKSVTQEIKDNKKLLLWLEYVNNKYYKLVKEELKL